MMKRTLLIILMLVLGLGLRPALLTTAAENKADAERIAKLIEQLGSGKFAEREAASKELERIGVPALEALRKATKSNDLETRRRAAELVEKLSKLELSARILAPTKIRLVYKETPVTEAVADIAKKTGFQITLVGNTDKVAERKVTIDTGETTFWQAFDQFCEKAGLVEAGAGGRPVPADRPRPLPPVKIAPAKAVPAKPAEGKAPAKEKEEPNVKVKPVQGNAVEVRVAVAVAPVQAAPAPGAPAAPAVQFARVVRPGYRRYNPQQILLVDGKPERLPTCYAGAVRIRALPPNTPVPASLTKEGEKLLILEASPEPKLLWQSVQGVRIEKAIDDNDQQLEGSMTAGEGQVPGGPIAFNKVMADNWMRMYPGQREIPIRLKAGEKPSKKLKEISGAISAQVLTPPEAMMTVENLMKAASKTVKGKEGGYLKVIDAKREDDLVKLQIELEMPPNVHAASGAVGDIGFGMGMPMPAIQIVPPQQAPPAPAPAPAPKQGVKAPAGQGDEVRVVVAQAAAQAVAQAAPPPPAAPAAPAQAPPAVAVAAKPLFLPNFNGLSLVDAKGKGFQLVSVTTQARGNGKTIIFQYTLTYKVAKDQGDPIKLSFSGQRLATVDVPFALKDVPLP